MQNKITRGKMSSDEYDFGDAGDAYDFRSDRNTYGYSAPPEEPFRSVRNTETKQSIDSREHDRRVDSERDSGPNVDTVASSAKAQVDGEVLESTETVLKEKPRHALGFTSEDCGGANIESTWKGHSVLKVFLPNSAGGDSRPRHFNRYENI